MTMEIQRAGFWKRASAFLLDLILTSVLAVGFAAGVSALTGYDKKADELDACYARYEEEYGAKLDLSEEEFLALSEEEQILYKTAAEALSKDEEASRLFTLTVNLALVSVSLGILPAVLLTGFAVPLYLGNGMTVGKKIFGLCVIHTNAVRIRPRALLVRTLFGKYTLEIMVPVLTVVLLWFRFWGLTGIILLLGILMLQTCLLFFTENRTLLHDLLASTLVADYRSQRVFESADELKTYLAKKAAERASQMDSDW